MAEWSLIPGGGAPAANDGSRLPAAPPLLAPPPPPAGCSRNCAHSEVTTWDLVGSCVAKVPSVASCWFVASKSLRSFSYSSSMSAWRATRLLYERLAARRFCCSRRSRLSFSDSSNALARLPPPPPRPPPAGTAGAGMCPAAALSTG
jgi:hypothetical protein